MNKLNLSSCPTLPVPRFQLGPSLELWNVSNGINQLRSFNKATEARGMIRVFFLAFLMRANVNHERFAPPSRQK
jgi:hypothetical protein